MPILPKSNSCRSPNGQEQLGLMVTLQGEEGDVSGVERGPTNLFVRLGNLLESNCDTCQFSYEYKLIDFNLPFSKLQIWLANLAEQIFKFEITKAGNPDVEMAKITSVDFSFSNSGWRTDVGSFHR